MAVRRTFLGISLVLLASCSGNGVDPAKKQLATELGSPGKSFRATGTAAQGFRSLLSFRLDGGGHRSTDAGPTSVTCVTAADIEKIVLASSPDQFQTDGVGTAGDGSFSVIPPIAPGAPGAHPAAAAVQQGIQKAFLGQTGELVGTFACPAVAGSANRAVPFQCAIDVVTQQPAGLLCTCANSVIPQPYDRWAPINAAFVANGFPASDCFLVDDQGTSHCPGETGSHVIVVAPSWNPCTGRCELDLDHQVSDHDDHCEWGCFALETPIRKADGTTVEARSVRRGDALWNPKTRRTATVDEVVVGGSLEPVVVVRFATTELRVTALHPFPTARGLLMARQLRVGDRIGNPDGGWTRVTGLSTSSIEDGRSVANFVVNAGSERDADHFVVAGGVVTGDLYLQRKLSRARKVALAPR